MNATQTRSEEIGRYLERVRAALADLPTEARDELLEDLPAHLAEVASEDQDSLAERLGPPERYAAELRAAAGLAPGTTDGGGPGLASLMSRLTDRARTADARVGPLLGYPRLSEFVRLLRPAWWVARGYLVFYLISGHFWGTSYGILPRFYGHLVFGLPVALAAIAVSVALGRRLTGLRAWPRRGLVLANLVLAVFGLVALRQMDVAAAGGWNQTVYENPVGGVVDIYPRGVDGSPLSGVSLFDQNGAPIQLGNPWRCQNPVAASPDAPYTYPLCPLGPGAVAQASPSAPGSSSSVSPTPTPPGRTSSPTASPTP
jgi:hypothetical protein